MEEYEDDGTWIWVSFAPKYRLVIAHSVGERKQYVADEIVNKTCERIGSKPLFVTDGLKFYTKALLKKFNIIVEFPRTGKRGRPRKPKLLPDSDLRYAQVIKHRSGSRLREVEKRIVFGSDIDENEISTSLIERQNLTFRQDNNRISRKTIGFSKKIKRLDDQMTLYFTHFDFCRGHWSLKHLNEKGRWERYTPTRECGLTNHNWTMRELLTFPYHQNIN
jgi:IS1 family transposase